ncbi:hypothetical protein WJX77_010710 [Trebouxia sp. C0004]
MRCTPWSTRVAATTVSLPCRTSVCIRSFASTFTAPALGYRRRLKLDKRGAFKSGAIASSEDAGNEGWFGANASRLRALPLVAGASGIVGVLLNRILSGVAPVVDASSSQSRADVLVILLSAVLLLTGLQWLALRPKVKPSVALHGDQLEYMKSGLSSKAKQELQWAWQSLKDCSTCQAVVILYKSSCVMHMGVARAGHKPEDALLGPICRRAMSSEQGNYLANLALYPGRVEFTSILPENTQAAIIQPIGSEGVLIAASNTQRGFTRLDQAWASTIADKLDASLEATEGSKTSEVTAASTTT